MPWRLTISCRHALWYKAIDLVLVGTISRQCLGYLGVVKSEPLVTAFSSRKGADDDYNS